MCRGVLSTCLSVPYTRSTSKGQKRVLNRLELESQAVVSCTGNEPRSSGDINQGAISPFPRSISFLFVCIRTSVCGYVRAFVVSTEAGSVLDFLELDFNDPAWLGTTQPVCGGLNSGAVQSQPEVRSPELAPRHSCPDIYMGAGDLNSVREATLADRIEGKVDSHHGFCVLMTFSSSHF